MTDAGTLERARNIFHSLELGHVDDSVTISPLGGGASNENFVVTAGGSSWVLRIASPHALSDRFKLDRWSGFAGHQHAVDAGVAPVVRAIILPAGHTLVDFIDGETLTSETVRDGSNLEDATRGLRTVHLGSTWGCTVFNGDVEVKRFMAIIRDEKLTPPDDIHELVSLSSQINDVFQSIGVPQVLCHNDVQIANLMRSPGGKLWIIDWEYAGVGNPYFDLAMLVNNADLSDGETGRVLTAYFGTDRDCDRARIDLCRFQSALREALWSVVAEPVLTTGWDYQEWAERFFTSARKIQTRIHSDELLQKAGKAPDDDTHFERLVRHDR